MSRVLLVVGILITFAATASSAFTTQAKKAPAKATATAAAPLNLNTATVAQLETLPGIGGATAKRIIEHRQKNGGFKKVEELMNIKGIGEKSFLKLKPLVTVAAERADRAGDK
jgi:competence protein ComEA